MKDEKNIGKMTDAMNELGDDLIRDAEDNVPAIIKRPKNAWVKWVALAAAVLLIAIAVPVAIRIHPGKNADSKAPATYSGEKDKTAPAINAGTTEAPEDVGGWEAELAEEPAAVSGKSDTSFYSKDGDSGAEYSGGERTSDVIAPGDTGDPVVKPGVEPDDPGVEPVDPDDPVVDPTVGPDETEPVLPAAHQLTAAAWDDNLHYLKWRELFEKNEQNQVSGKFGGDELAIWNLNSDHRIEVTVKCNDYPLYEAVVTMTTQEGRTFTARTNRNGVAYVFGIPAGTLTVTSHESDETVTMAVNGEREIAVQMDLDQMLEMEPMPPFIQLMYVVDVTGSMGDEIRYLQAELGNVVQEVVKANPGVQVSLALLFYRDHGDTEEFRYVDFKDVTDPADYESHLSILKKQEAAGGGDYPEALDEALEQAIAGNWWTGSTKVLFHVFDAPAHDETENRTRLAAAIQAAAEKGVRICPVLASGADTLTEYIARSEAILTGGTFVFLTNDSGIGGDHLDPSLPDAVHEYLNDCMIRLINGYHTGTFADPVPWNQ